MSIVKRRRRRQTEIIEKSSLPGVGSPKSYFISAVSTNVFSLSDRVLVNKLQFVKETRFSIKEWAICFKFVLGIRVVLNYANKECRNELRRREASAVASCGSAHRIRTFFNLPYASYEQNSYVSLVENLNTASFIHYPRRTHRSALGSSAGPNSTTTLAAAGTTHRNVVIGA
jgi:hypothetical protein